MKIIKMPGKQVSVKVHAAHIPVTSPPTYAKLPTKVSSKGLPGLANKPASVKAVGMKVAVPPTNPKPLPSPAVGKPPKLRIF